MPDTDSRRLILMRHAKTEQYASDDHARDLTDRGRRDARAAGAWLTGQGIAVNVALISSAVRARSTWRELGSALAGVDDTSTHVLPSLYGADADEVLAECARLVPAPARTALIVGHNPTIEMTAERLNASNPGAADLGFPTAAMAVFELSGHWQEVADGAVLVAHYLPSR